MVRFAKRAAAVGAILALATVTAAAEKTETVHFDKGKPGKTIEGSIKGDDSINYMLGVGDGQVMQVLFTPQNTSCYFNVFEPGKADSAIFIGSSTGNEFSLNPTKKGNYRVQVYLMRNAARRDETCKYSISFEVSGATAAGHSAATESEDTMRKMCIGEVSGMYGVKPPSVELAPSFGTGDDGNKIMNGQVNKGSEGYKEFRCIYDASGKLLNVMAMTPDGE